MVVGSTGSTLSSLMLAALCACFPGVSEAQVVVREVQVRGVQVREVNVPQPRPAVNPRAVIPRPMLPDVISRPYQSPYPSSYNRAQPVYGHRSYSNSSHVKGGYVGYPVYPYAYPYPFIYEPPAIYVPSEIYVTPAPYSAFNMAPPPATTYSNVETPAAGAPSVAGLACTGDPGSPAACGGLSFDISPLNAQVYVEGVYVGTVDNFSPVRAPFALAPGLHYVEVRFPGYRTATFEVTIGAGEVTPFQGALEPLRTR